MASLGTMLWSGASKKDYQFHVYPITERCPAEAGIYIFSKAEPNTTGGFTHHPIYIGKAIAFDDRFLNHHKGGCIEKNGANRICLMQVKTEAERTAIENDLLKRWPTKCNEVNNPVTPK